jgi:phosphatidylglycerophosphatase A
MTNKFYTILATWFYVGRAPVAPGTFGSIAGIIVFYLFNSLINLFSYNDLAHFLTVFFTGAIIVSILLFTLGVFVSNKYLSLNESLLNSKDKDPKEVVIDEVVGQFLTCSFVILTPLISQNQYIKNMNNNYKTILCLYVMPFLLFRFFDILKPYPIKNIEHKFQNGFGIMIDDILAACFAIIIQYFICLKIFIS